MNIRNGCMKTRTSKGWSILNSGHNELGILISFGAVESTMNDP